MGCGGAIQAKRGAKVGAQYCKFVSNNAVDGGAICFEADGTLDLVEIEFSANSASRGDDIFLGRPSPHTPGRVELLGVSLSSAHGFDHNVTDSIALAEQLWLTSSCPADVNCMFREDAGMEYTALFRGQLLQCD